MDKSVNLTKLAMSAGMHWKKRNPYVNELKAKKNNGK